MRFGLTARVVTTVVVLAVGVVAVDALVTRWAFQARFLSYVSEQERDSLERLAETIAAFHEEEGSLEALSEAQTMLRVLRRAFVAESRFGSRRERTSGIDRPSGDARRRFRKPGDGIHPDGPPPGPGPGPGPGPAPGPERDAYHDDRHPPPHLRPDPGREDAGGTRRRLGERSRLERRFIESEIRRRVGSLVPRLTVTLADGTEVLSASERLPAEAERIERAVEVDGETVATLALVPVRELARERDQRFVRDHFEAIAWIAAAAAAIASIVGFLLARRMIVPIQAVAAGARTLAEGRYDLELDAKRSDEIGGLARDFNSLARTLEATAEARERWVADVAHELRTPVAVLRGEIDALRDGIRPLNDDALASLDGEVGRLTRLIDDLHDLTLADAGALAYRFDDVDLGELLTANALRYRDRLANAGLSLDFEAPTAPLPCRADVGRLEQLLANLLENSLRYTDAPGPVRIHASATDTRIRLIFEDSAPGVPESEQAHLFERFRRVDAHRNRASGGAGLGLAIVERIVAAHDGTIHARSSALGGLAIEIELPRTSTRS